MAAFNWEEARADWRTYDLFRLGPVTLFYQAALLDDTVQHLGRQNYAVLQVDCRTSNSESDFYNSILIALGVLKSEYQNIQPIQFWDLVTETEFGDAKGIVLVFRHFDAFHSQFPDCAQDALRVLAGYQYRWLWFGHRYTTIVQTDDPMLQLQFIRKVEANWNNRECSVKERSTE